MPEWRVVHTLVVAASVLLLAGCSSMFAPDPTDVPIDPSSPTRTFASVNCTPSTTKFVWVDSPIESTFEAVSTRLQSYGSGESGSSQDAQDPDYSLGADQGALAAGQGETALGEVLDDLDAWTPDLARGVRDYTSAPADFGKVSGIIDTTPFDPPKPHTGSWVRVVVAQSQSYRFTMTCLDGTTATGTFGGVLPATAAEFTIHCSVGSHPRDTPQRAAVRAQCPQG